MARLFLILAVAAVIVAFVAILVSVWNAAYEGGHRALRPLFGSGQEGLMTPTTLQKVSYIALIVLVFGVCTGWLGGL